MLFGKKYNINLYPITDWIRTIGNKQISKTENIVNIFFKLSLILKTFLLFKKIMEGIKFIIQSKIALFAGGIIITPLLSTFLYKVRYIYVLLIMEGKQNVKRIKTIIIKNAFSFVNLILLILFNKEPKIRVLNIIEN